MSTIQTIFDEVTAISEQGGWFVEVAELRLEYQLAQLAERKRWLESLDDNMMSLDAQLESRDDAVDRPRFSQREMKMILERLNTHEMLGRRDIAGLYSNLSFLYRRNAEVEEHMQAAEDFFTIPGWGTPAERKLRWFLGAERCAEKAIDFFGLTAEEIMFLPANYDSGFFFLLFWNLASAKYVLEKPKEAQYYLTFCLKIRVEDEELRDLQQNALVMYQELGNVMG
jgi:hypothetical protein